MDAICLNDIKGIIHSDGGAHVSMFMPTHHRGGMDQQDPIRFRNLIKSAEEKLVAHGLRAAEARLLLRPAESLTTDNLFWRQQSEGLALFISSNIYFYYRVPVVLREEVGVGERFYIKPLVPMLGDCGWYYVLALGQDEVRLLQCTAFGSVNIPLDNIIKNKAEALRFTPPDNRTQYHVPAPAGGSNFGGATAIQEGEGSRPNYNKRNMMQFFSQVSRGIQEILKIEVAPMVLAAVDYLHPMYREANLYKNLLDEGIMGSPKGVADDTLREQAWAIVKPYFEKAQRDALAEYLKSAGTGLTASGLNDVVPVAVQGRVRFLFIAENAQFWGKYIPDENSAVVHSQPEPADEDLIDFAAYQTLNNSGQIYVLKPENMPGGAPIAAVLRF